MVGTFKTLVGLADFQTEAPGVSTALPEDTTGAGEGEAPRTLLQGQAKGGLAVNINIQLSLPENASAETFDAFFKSMKKHLLD